MKSAVILISGRGSNMQALVQGATGIQVTAVISSRPEAAGLDWARDHGIETRVVDHKGFVHRESFDLELGNAVARYQPDWVFQAGFMRIVGESFVDRFAGRILNIHPSLLPAFPGLHTHRRALQAGARIHGASVHFVTAELDAGPIVVQAAVPVLPDDTEASLAARVLVQEHRIYPLAARWLAEGRIDSPRDGVVQFPGAGFEDDFLVSPREPA